MYRDCLSFSSFSYQDLVFKEPKSYKEAMSSQQSEDWRVAMEDEMNSLIKKNQTWTLVPKFEGKALVDCKYLFSVKEENTEKLLITFKTRFVAKGFTHKEGIDYNEKNFPYG